MRDGPSVAPAVSARAGAVRQDLRAVAAAFGGVTFAVCVLVPWVPGSFVARPSDFAYPIFSHMGFSQGEPWGVATLHTSGPLAFLRLPVFYRPTFALLLVANAALAIAVASLIHHLAARHAPPLGRFALVVAAAWVLCLGDDAVWLFALLLPQLLIPPIERAPRWTVWPSARWLSWPLLVSLGVCAVAANAKGSFLLMAALLSIELAALELRARRAPSIAAAFALLVVLIARLAGLGLADWGPYLTHVLGSLRGYAEVFAEPGSVLRAAALYVSILWFLALAARDVFAVADPVEAAIRWGTLTALLLIDAKTMLVRQDWVHEGRALASLLVFVGVYTLRRAHGGVAASAVRAIPVVVLALLLVSNQASIRPDRRVSLGHKAVELASFLRRGAAAGAADEAAARKAVASEFAWPPRGSVAVFGAYQSLLLTHPERAAMLPILVPYEIWSPWSSRREREFLLGPRAPDYLVYAQSPSSAELALTLASRYAEVERHPRYWLLRRRAVALAVEKRTVFAASVDAGETVPIPPEWRGGLAVAEVRYRKTVVGQVLSALYQPPSAFLVLFKGGVVTTRIRMNPLLAGEGIVLAGREGVWDGNPSALHGMRFGPLAGERVDATALGFEGTSVFGAGWRRYFRPRVDLRIYVPELG